MMEQVSGFQDVSTLSTNVRVLVRLRPGMAHEAAHTTEILQLDALRNQISMNFAHHSGGDPTQLQNGTASAYSFDACLDGQSDQAEVFARGRVGEMVQAVIQGFSATIFAFGQTGSGKTYTMEGHVYKSEQSGNQVVVKPSFDETPEEQYGVALRSINCLYQLLQQQSHEQQEPERPAKSYIGMGPRLSHLRVRWDSQRDFYVENQYSFECKTAKDAIALYRQGIGRRVVAGHKMNAASSRSHCLFTLQLEQVDPSLPQDVVISRLILVDLAGSERTAFTGATGHVLNQSIAINKSLFTLRKVIATLAAAATKDPAPVASNSRGNRRVSIAAPQHIPYRDSTLTRLLKPCLGGNSLTLMIACLAPSDTYVEENISTLNYASLAKRITNVATINEDPKTRLIRQLRAQVKFLNAQLAHSRQVYISDTNGTLVMRDSSDLGPTSLVPGPNASTSHSNPASTMFPSFLNSSPVANVVPVQNTTMIMRELVDDNNQLRWAIESHSNQQEQREYDNFILNRENDELRERIQFLESVIVGEQEELLESITNPTRWQNSDVVSPHEETTLNPHSPTAAASADQASVIDVENRRLRAIVKETVFELQQSRQELQQVSAQKASLLAAMVVKNGIASTKKRPSTQVPSIPAVSSASRRVEAIMRNVWSDSNSPVTATKRTTIAPFSASRPRPEHTSTAQLPTSASPYIRPPSKLIQPQKSISTAASRTVLSSPSSYVTSIAVSDQSVQRSANSGGGQTGALTAVQLRHLLNPAASITSSGQSGRPNFGSGISIPAAMSGPGSASGPRSMLPAIVSSMERTDGTGRPQSHSEAGSSLSELESLFRERAVLSHKFM